MIPNATKDVCSKPSIPTPERLLSQSAFTTSLRGRPIVYNAQHIDDHKRRHSNSTNQRRYSQLNEGSLLMTNDPNSVFYRYLGETYKQQSVANTLQIEEKEKFKLLEKYGPDLVDFLKDSKGHLKSKFDKVFIT